MKLHVLLPLIVSLLGAPLAMADNVIAKDAELATGSMLADPSISADATISATTNATTTLAIGTRKFRPGHYTALLRSLDSQAVMQASIRPGVVG